ncbi:MAG TPA: EAL domain-containing protein [Acidimicrobiales bacterium]|nr:EAL domain-containing protein [Acidimicrobiales bacterium]
MSAIGFSLVQSSNEAIENSHVQDRLSQDRTLANLTGQYFQLAFKEAYDFASAQTWSLKANDPGDVARLQSLTQRTLLVRQGAALVGLDGKPLSSFSQSPGLPDPSDPGYAPMRSALLAGQPGLSSIMHVSGVAVGALAVPVLQDGAPRAVLVAFFRADQSPLQAYVEGVKKEHPAAARYLVDQRGAAVTSTDPKLIGTDLTGLRPVARAVKGQWGTDQFTYKGVPQVSSALSTGTGGWSFVSVEPSSSFFATARTSRHRQALALLAVMAGGLAAIVLLNARAEMARRRSSARFRSLVQNASDMIMIVDAESRTLYDSPSVGRTLGYRFEDRVGQPSLQLVHPDDLALAEATLAQLLIGGSGTARVELRVRRADGTYGWYEATASNQLHDASVRGIVVNLRDIKERRTFEERLTHQAFHDPLTGLPNRALFQDRLAVALSRRHPSDSQIGVLFLDLDRFKVVNDSLGHEAGDRLLEHVAERLKAGMRPEDTLARMSGDEFTVLLEDVQDARDAEHVAERLIDSLRSPFVVAGREVYVGVSIGIALGRRGATPEDLVRDADLAMYRAKERGRRRYEVFASDLGDQARNRLELESDLRQAIERGELRLHYQPEIDLADRCLVGVEALVRWQHPTRGLLVPAQFIPIAEETGLIIPLGAWVLEQACLELRRWATDHPERRRLRMSVNVSGRQLEQQRRLVDTVASVLQETGVDPGLLTLELTESVLMDNTEVTVTTLRELRALGVELAIDDFGTGYSSLNYLKHFPISTLKLDRSFVHGLGNDDADAAIAQSAIGLAHALNLRVTAEGIELDDQLTRLRAMGCDRGQGFHFSRPVPAAELEELVSQLQQL